MVDLTRLARHGRVKEDTVGRYPRFTGTGIRVPPRYGVTKFPQIATL
jgi:hypothetical protein